jgi:hypothetical protein
MIFTLNKKGKKMKKINLLLILSLTAVLFAACDEFCGIEPPLDIKPIDWKNYNDVSTVYWNTYSNKKLKNFPRDKEIMIYGLVYFSDSYYINESRFELVNGFSDLLGDDVPPEVHVTIIIPSPEVRTVFNNYDFLKRCYVKGKLGFAKLGSGICTKFEPTMVITNTNDIYFK